MYLTRARKRAQKASAESGCKILGCIRSHAGRVRPVTHSHVGQVQSVLRVYSQVGGLAPGLRGEGLPQFCAQGMLPDASQAWPALTCPLFLGNRGAVITALPGRVTAGEPSPGPRKHPYCAVPLTADSQFFPCGRAISWHGASPVPCLHFLKGPSKGHRPHPIAGDLKSQVHSEKSVGKPCTHAS